MLRDVDPRAARSIDYESRDKGMNMNRALWIVQGLLAAVFLFSGVMKLVLPLEQMAGPVDFPGWFLRFIGVAETLGGIGLILPALLRIKPGLTPLAAVGLVIIMIGAVGITLPSMGVLMALLPLIVGVLAAFVAYGRWRLVPLGESSRVSTVGAAR
jgi:uncharacterized membrane protein YphA (DoxX/SURF4 family)